MGQLICNALKESPMVAELTVCDPKFPEAFCEDEVQYLPSSQDLYIPSFHSIFVATPAEMHYKHLTDLIQRGAKNIYVEKPAVTSLDQYEHLKSIAGNCRIVIGYILRQSETAIALRQYLQQAEEEGFYPTLCNVTYQKYMPFHSDERAKTDLGVDEELVHVYDMVFNYFGFKKAETIHVCNRIEYDSEREDRIIRARHSYLMDFHEHYVMVNIKSSFRSKDQCREFFFTLSNDKGARRTIRLSFDTPGYIDKLRITSQTGEDVFRLDYPSLQKLNHQMNEVLDYFGNGNIQHLANLDDSKTVITHMQRNSHKG